MLTTLQLRWKTFNFAVLEGFPPVFLRVLIQSLMATGSMTRFPDGVETDLTGRIFPCLFLF